MIRRRSFLIYLRNTYSVINRTQYNLNFNYFFYKNIRFILLNIEVSFFDRIFIRRFKHKTNLILYFYFFLSFVKTYNKLRKLNKYYFFKNVFVLNYISFRNLKLLNLNNFCLSTLLTYTINIKKTWSPLVCFSINSKFFLNAAPILILFKKRVVLTPFPIIIKQHNFLIEILLLFKLLFKLFLIFNLAIYKCFIYLNLLRLV